jgi:hypothetical protein
VSARKACFPGLFETRPLVAPLQSDKLLLERSQADHESLPLKKIQQKTIIKNLFELTLGFHDHTKTKNKARGDARHPDCRQFS